MKTLDPTPENIGGQPKYPAVIHAESAGIRGKLPMRTGKLLLTSEEEKALRAFGWKPGMALPGDLPEKLKAAREALDNEIKMTDPRRDPVRGPGTIKSSIPETIDIDKLDPVKRAEIEGYLKDFQTQAPQIEAALKSQAGFSQLTPSVQKALADAGEGIEVVDSRAASFQRQIDLAEGKIQPEAKAELEVKEEPPDEIDHNDKVKFVTDIMGGPSFEKTYELFGGQASVTFRRLLRWEAENIVLLVEEDLKKGTLLPERAIQRGLDYRLMVSLVSYNGSVAIKNDKTDVITAAGLNDFLAGFSEPEWHILQTMHDKFCTLCETLEQKADDPNFWTAIES